MTQIGPPRAIVITLYSHNSLELVMHFQVARDRRAQAPQVIEVYVVNAARFVDVGPRL